MSPDAMRKRLDAQVEQIKARRKARGEEAPSSASFVSVGEVLRKRFGLLPLESDEEAEKRLEENSRAEQAALDQQRQHAIYKRAVPPMFREPWSYDKVDASVDRSEVDAALNWRFGPRGIFLIGDTGRSKSRAVFFLVKRLILVERLRVVVHDGISFSNACSVSFSEPSSTEVWLRSMTRCDVLVIDDLAKRFTPAAQQGAFAVIDRRGAQLRPTIVTTNDSGDNLRAKITDRNLADPLIRRLREYCDIRVF